MRARGGTQAGLREPLADPPNPIKFTRQAPKHLVKLVKLWGNLGLGSTSQQLMAKGAFPMGVTYPFNVSGNSLRMERLPQGAASLSPLLGTPYIQGVNTALVPNDVRAQQVLGLFLNGCFVQFESTNAPVLIMRPGEVFKLPFTKLFVTVFGSAGRFRLVAGNQVSVSEFSDERVLRQNIAFGDGSGTLPWDNPMLHPIPFNAGATITGDGSVALSTLLGGAILTNYDSGAGLAQQGGGNGPVTGQVVNKGYLIYWISSIRIAIQPLTMTGDYVQTLALIKSKASPASSPGTAGTIPMYAETLYVYGGASPTLINLTRDFNIPKRIVLAGFDTYDPNSGGVQGTGETLFLYSKGNTVQTVRCSIDGYYVPALVPFNPYPMDASLLPLD